jgi:hypothetical protein
MDVGQLKTQNIMILYLMVVQRLPLWKLKVQNHMVD